MRDLIITMVLATADAGDPARLVERQLESPQPPTVTQTWLDSGYAARFCNHIDRGGLLFGFTDKPALGWVYLYTTDPVRDLQTVVDKAHENYWRRK